MGINFEYSLDVMIWHEIYSLLIAKEDFVEVHEGLTAILYDFVVRVEWLINSYRLFGLFRLRIYAFFLDHHEWHSFLLETSYTFFDHHMLQKVLHVVIAFLFLSCIHCWLLEVDFAKPKLPSISYEKSLELFLFGLALKESLKSLILLCEFLDIFPNEMNPCAVDYIMSHAITRNTLWHEFPILFNHHLPHMKVSKVLSFVFFQGINQTFLL